MIRAHAATVPEMDRYEVNAVTGCWLWLGYTDKAGYARLAGENAHRVFYRVHVASIAQGHDIDHLCKRRNCVNPAHLESVPEAENLRRQSREVIYLGKRFDICKEGHPMDAENTRIRPNGKRECRACARARTMRVGEAKAAAAGRTYRPRGVAS